jgi:dienelactone hydrolase
MRTIRIAPLVAACMFLPAAARAEVKTKEIEYKQGDTPLQGFVAWDDAAKGKRPGVLVIHEWWGHNEHARNQAIRLARSGYVGFALDMFGKGKVATHPKDAQALAAEANRDPKVVKARFDAALAQLKKDPHVDPKRIGVVGYCMGGNIALARAAAGEDLDAVATFHAGVQNIPELKKGKVKARILVNNGADDPMAPAAKVDALKQAFTEAGARIEVISYPGAKHGFTNPAADNAGMPALGYNADADSKSWENTVKMFQEVFRA